MAPEALPTFTTSDATTGVPAFDHDCGEPLPAFGSDFRWGTATAAYQIEGAADSDGRGPSIWDTFSHQPGRIREGHTGDVACDHYHRWEEDLTLAAGLGLDSYRFSIAWSRVQPDGQSAVNPAGLNFYDRLVDRMLELGLSPFPTLFHWDLPQALEDRGGWLNRDTAYRFADYAALVADRLGDRVPQWITLNEPFIHMAFGYALGVHAPGHELYFGALPAGHHQLLGHGLAAAALAERGGAVLLTNNCTPVTPASDQPEDLAAAAVYDTLHNRFFLDPVLTGRYPELLEEMLTASGTIHDGDLKTIAAPLDGLGINYYTPTLVSAPPAGSEDSAPPLPFLQLPIDGVPHTGFGWPVVPSGLRDLLVGLRDRYGADLPPIYVTENGCAYPDPVEDDGQVRDQERIAFLDAHVRAVREAITAGVDVRGYFVWSLLDNFEWAEGYTQRFGLVHVDFETQVRTPKASYHWYAEQVRAQRAGTR
ncbi:MAG TPA: GH1 family beta-glucosidase [Kineosporiaceae bacterium]|nr:GH1 family beta-glucosidase [Kineosporiaceae bacterium]